MSYDYGAWWRDLDPAVRDNLRAGHRKPATLHDWSEVAEGPDGLPLHPPEPRGGTLLLPRHPDELDRLAGLDPEETP